MTAALPAGIPAPEFTLKREDGSDFTRAELVDRTTVLVFYPFAFSGVCSDQLQAYDEVREELAARGVTLYAVSTDARQAQRAFKQALGIGIEQLSDFEPKGVAARAFGAYFEPAGCTARALVIVGPDAKVVWSHRAESLNDLPGVNLIFDGLAAA